MTSNERIEKTLNRAGQTISDLPEPSEWGTIYAHDVYDPNICDTVLKQAIDFQYVKPSIVGLVNEYSERWMLVDYILHLSEIIDRFEWALENQVTLHENLMHVIGNADIPDGVSYDQFCLVVDNIYKAVQTAQEGWENYEEGVPKDGSVDDEEGL